MSKLLLVVVEESRRPSIRSVARWWVSVIILAVVDMTCRRQRR